MIAGKVYIELKKKKEKKGQILTKTEKKWNQSN